MLLTIYPDLDLELKEPREYVGEYSIELPIDLDMLQRNNMIHECF